MSVEKVIKSFQTGSILGTLAIPSQFLPQRQDIIYRCLRYEESWIAQGTESTKQLGQVRGSSNKPFPQKGRGKARVGTIRAPQHKGGYTVHGPRPHTKMININRKVYELGLKSCFGIKSMQDQLHFVDDLIFTGTKKSELQEHLERLGLLGKKIYFITQNQGSLVRISDQFTKKLKIQGEGGENPILMTDPKYIGVKNLMDYEHLVIDKQAMEYLLSKYS